MYTQKGRMENKKPFAMIFVIILVTGLIALSNFNSVQAVSDAKAKNDITDSIGSAVEGSWSSIGMVNISKHFLNGTVTVYNKTLETNGPK